MNKILKILTALGLLWTVPGLLQAEVLQLAAGDNESLALVTGGDVFQWGEIGGPLPVPVFGLDHVTAIAAGAHHMLALKSDGTVWAWGNNSAGQLGNGTAFDTDRPTKVMDITGAIAIAAAGHQSYALKNDGTVWAWGANARGQLGDGTAQDRRGPVVVEGLIDATAIAAGTNIFVALRKDGGVCTLGSLGARLDCNNAIHGVTAVAAGDNAGYVLLRDGTVRTLGGGSCGTDFIQKDLILEDVRQMAAGGSHLLFIKDDGTLWSCGWNGFERPVQATGGVTGATRIAAGASHVMAANEAGVWAWGDNASGQLGTGDKNARSQFGPVWDGTGRLR